MTPHAFIAKWRDATVKERAAAQEHFLDLCRLLDEPTPAEADPTGATYCFERGAYSMARSTQSQSNRLTTLPATKTCWRLPLQS